MGDSPSFRRFRDCPPFLLFPFLMIPVQKIISGGQTGVDRAALDFAIERGIPHGGYCPKGRRAEDGQIPNRYQLVETESEEYSVRTEKNVKESDGTLIFYRRTLTGGTLLTAELCQAKKKPHFIVDLDNPPEDLPHTFNAWLTTRRIRILNIAGSRESSENNIYAKAKACLPSLFQLTAEKRRALARKRGRRTKPTWRVSEDTDRWIY